MNRSTFFSIALLGLIGCQAESGRHEILSVLDRQTAAWNEGDIEGFMAHYWQSDKLTFVSSHQEQDPETGASRLASTTTRGWQATLERYQKRYPTPEAMGRLSFSELSITLESGDTAKVVGRYRLTRKEDTPTGRFTLNMRHINGHWLITRDHTTAD
ncbi:MAG: YybH family protein [Phycisphaerae bacterium]